MQVGNNVRLIAVLFEIQNLHRDLTFVKNINPSPYNTSSSHAGTKYLFSLRSLITYS